jgi:hypothetical protein
MQGRVTMNQLHVSYLLRILKILPIPFSFTLLSIQVALGRLIIPSLKYILKYSEKGYSVYTSYCNLTFEKTKTCLRLESSSVVQHLLRMHKILSLTPSTLKKPICSPKHKVKFSVRQIGFISIIYIMENSLALEE